MGKRPSRAGSIDERASDWIVNSLLANPGVEERKSRFADRTALSFRGVEFFHLDKPGLADVRLGRKAIRSNMDALRSDPRIELRSTASDWVQVRFRTQKDAECVLSWAKVAIDAGG